MQRCIYCNGELTTGDINYVCTTCRSKGYGEFKAPRRDTFSSNSVPPFYIQPDEQELKLFEQELKNFKPIPFVSLVPPTTEAVEVLKPGDCVVYRLVEETTKTVIKFEPGIVKRLSPDGKYAFVWYHSGCTAARTNIADLMLVPDSEMHTGIHRGCTECMPQITQERITITEFKAKRVHEITGRGKVYTIDMRLYPQYTIRIGDYIKIDDTEGVVRGIECLGSNPEIGVFLRETSRKSVTDPKEC